ncbi:MAG: N-(5'-phosphoribosyl)anthranilate isomerase [Sulfolobaceae archaeon]|nr:N-(5'-phosphoribosyl)anthranilate isomerase [Sulfolobaceae archaeon]
MGIKLKICGIGNLADAIAINSIDGVSYMGMINDPISPRFVSDLELLKVARIVDKPLVAVRVNGTISDIDRIPTKMVQIHRVLNDRELEELSMLSKRFILFVPASLDYLDYLKKAQKYSDYILFDSPRKGIEVNLEVVKKMLDYHPDAGVGGKINLSNVHEFIRLNPGWIDVSSGIEFYPGKKDLDKVRRLAEVVKNA